MFHTGAPVVTWMDPGGFDAYRTERRFAPATQASFNATTQEAEKILKATGKPAGHELEQHSIQCSRIRKNAGLAFCPHSCECGYR